jgi:hypothetical protein
MQHCIALKLSQACSHYALAYLQHVLLRDAVITVYYAVGRGYIR